MGNNPSTYDFAAAKVEWRIFCETEPSITLYQQPWYWDATCDVPTDWRVILVKKEGIIEAAFPFSYVQRKFMWFIETPWQVPASGIWMKKKREDFRSIEADFVYMTDIVNAVVDRLPYFDCFRVGFNSRLWSWQPFYWRGFNAKPHYTMVIPSMSAELIKTKCSKSRRRRLNKAGRDYRLEVNRLNLAEYWDFFDQSYRKRGRNIEFSKAKFVRLINALKEHNAIQIRSVREEDGTLTAENIVFMDEGRFYHHFVAQRMDDDKEASSLAVYDSICEAMYSGKIYDFEGSMDNGVAMFNLSFNPGFETLFIITKESAKYRFLNGIRSAFCALKE